MVIKVPEKYDVCEKGVLVLAGAGKLIGIPGKEISYIAYVPSQNGNGIVISLKNGNQIKWPISKPGIYLRLLEMLRNCDRYFYVIKGADSMYIVENEIELGNVISGS